jgi:hypothetical protein
MIHSWNHCLDTLATTDDSIWNLARKIRHRKTSFTPLKYQGKLTTSDCDRAHVFGGTLHEIFQNSLKSPKEQDVLATITSLKFAPCSEIEPITVDEIKIARLKKKTAQGHNVISNRCIQSLPAPFPKFITNLFNSCLRNSHFPTSWKQAKIIPIPKPHTNLAGPLAYRPISLLPCISELFEKAVHWRLLQALSSEYILQHEQTDFRSHASTTHQILRLAEIIINSINI